MWFLDAAATMGFYYDPSPSPAEAVEFFAIQFGFVACFAWVGARFRAAARPVLGWYFFALGFMTLVPIALFDPARRP